MIRERTAEGALLIVMVCWGKKTLAIRQGERWALFGSQALAKQIHSADAIGRAKNRPRSHRKSSVTPRLNGCRPKSISLAPGSYQPFSFHSANARSNGGGLASTDPGLQQSRFPQIPRLGSSQSTASPNNEALQPGAEGVSTRDVFKLI